MIKIIDELKKLKLPFYLALSIYLLAHFIEGHWVGVHLGTIAGWIGAYYFIKQHNQ